jgi:RNA polymerase sigma-70 factor (ECF subfamily)
VSPPVSSPSVSASPCFTAPADQSVWFKQEVHPHDSQLKAYLRGSFPKMRDVDDVAQESYLRVWRRQAVQPIKSAKAFLFTIARRLAIDWIRHEKISAINAVEDLDSLAVYDDGSSAADAASRAEIIAMLIDAVDALPARCREVVILRKFKFLSARETALKLGIKEHTVETQLVRSNARIREYLEARGITSVLGRES